VALDVVASRAIIQDLPVAFLDEVEEFMHIVFEIVKLGSFDLLMKRLHAANQKWVDSTK
jgi:hypothetical protein